MLRIIAAAVALFVLAGCAAKDEQKAVSTEPTVTTSTPAPTTPMTPTVDVKKQVCELANAAAGNQLLGEARALGDYDDSENAALRAAVSTGYSTLAGQLYSIAVGAPAGLGPVFMRWAAASSEVARYVADHKPGHGNVLEFGPGQARMTAAGRAAEKICGHKLTNI